jgi:LAT3 family solute carrier family 43 protein 3
MNYYLVFGKASIELMLKIEGIYSNQCRITEHKPCPDQIYRINLIVNSGVVAAAVSQIFSGFVLDALGPKLTSMFFSLLLGLGLTLFGISNDTTFQAFIPAYILIGVGGPPLLLSSLHLSNLFINYASLIKSLFVALFGASAIVFFILGYLFEVFHFTRRELFIGYLPIIVFIFLSSMIWWSSKPYPQSRALAKGSFNSKIESQSLLKRKGFLRQLFSVEFLGLFLFMLIAVLQLDFFQSIVLSQLERRGDNQHVYSNAFSIISLLGFLGVPLIGFLLDKRGLTSTLLLVTTLQLLYNCLFMVPSLPLQFGTFAIFSVSKPCLYLSAYAFISNVMGFSNFGKLVGICSFMLGVFSAIQSQILKELENSSADMFWIQLGFVFATLVSYFFPFYLFLYNRVLERISKDKQMKGLLSNDNQKKWYDTLYS